VYGQGAGTGWAYSLGHFALYYMPLML